ncbi:E-selectin-like [Styela clava]
MEESETYSVSPSVVGVKETTTPSGAGVKDTTTPSAAGAEEKTTPSLAGVKETTTLSVASVKGTATSEGFKDKKSTSARTSTFPATSLWSTKEAFFSTFRPQTTKVEQSTVTVRTCPAPKTPDNGTVDTMTTHDPKFGQTIKYSCNAGYVLQGPNIGKCEENGTWGEVPTCVVDLACDFESSTNPTCGYTRVEGRFRREYRDNDVTGYVLAGKGKIRSLPRDLVSNEELCMSVDVKGTSDGELVAKAYDGTTTKAFWPFSASTNWKTEKFNLKKVNSADTKVQLELEASDNVELDNITTLNSSECYGLATPCVKRNLDSGTISPEQDLYSVDQEVSYSCSNGYTLEGGQTGICKANGLWSTTPVCSKTTIVNKSPTVTLSVAESLCENKLANIYDVTHYNLLLNYLRSIIPDREIASYVFTGMTYKNGQLYSMTNQAISLPAEVWRPDYPVAIASRPSVAVVVRQDQENNDQGSFNTGTTNSLTGAICENEL